MSTMNNMFSMKNIFHTNTCRLCLQVNVKVFKLGDTYKTFLETFYRINKCNFIFLADYCVCYICVKQLSNFYNFIQKVGYAQLIIQSLYKNYNMATETLIKNVDRTVCQMSLTTIKPYIVFSTLQSECDLDIENNQNNVDIGIDIDTNPTNKLYNDLDSLKSTFHNHISIPNKDNTPVVIASDPTVTNDLLPTNIDENESTELHINNSIGGDEPFETLFKTEEDDSVIDLDDPLDILEIEEPRISYPTNNLVVDNTCSEIDNKINELESPPYTDLKISHVNDTKSSLFKQTTCAEEENVAIKEDIFLDTSVIEEVNVQFINHDPFNDSVKEDKATELCDPLDNLAVENNPTKIDTKSKLSLTNTSLITIEEKEEIKDHLYDDKEFDDMLNTEMSNHSTFETSSNLNKTCNTSESKIKLDKETSEDCLDETGGNRTKRRRKKAKVTYVYKDDDNDDEIKEKKKLKSNKPEEIDEEYEPELDSTSHSEDSDYDQYNDEGKRVPKPKRKYPLQCDLCDLKVYSGTEHYQHYIAAHPTVDYPYKIEKTHACIYCGKLTFRHRLREHESTHNKDKTFKCPKCPKVFNSNVRLRSHIGSVHPNKKFECDYCSKQFNTKSDLERHIRLHTGEKPFPCHICGEAFAHKGNIAIHIRNRHQNLKHIPKKRKQNNNSCKVQESGSDDGPLIKKNIIQKAKKTTSGRNKSKKRKATQFRKKN